MFWGFATHYFDACVNKKKYLAELPCKWEHHAIGMLQDTKMTDVKFLNSNTLYWGDAIDLNRHRIKKTKKLKLISETGIIPDYLVANCFRRSMKERKIYTKTFWFTILISPTNFGVKASRIPLYSLITILADFSVGTCLTRDIKANCCFTN